MAEKGALGQYERSGDSMTCQRCGGRLFPACFESEDGKTLPAQHCLNCGEWTDALILQHRAMIHPPQPRNLHAVVYDPHEEEKLLLRWKARRDL
jgi:hypothetical protein